MNKEFLNSALALFNESEQWNAFIDLFELKDAVQKAWVDRATAQMKERFHSDEQWRIEFGNWMDARWHFISPSPIAVNFWLSYEGNLHFVAGGENGKKAELIGEIFEHAKYDPLRYVWGTDIQTNVSFNIKVKQAGKWYFDSPYDGDMPYQRLCWYAGNATKKYIDQIAEKVEKFRERSIVELLTKFQLEVESSFAENGMS